MNLNNAKWEAHSGEDYTVVMTDSTQTTDSASIHLYGKDAEELARLITLIPKMRAELMKIWMADEYDGAMTLGSAVLSNQIKASLADLITQINEGGQA